MINAPAKPLLQYFAAAARAGFALGVIPGLEGDFSPGLAT